MSDWKTCAEIIKGLEDEDGGFFMLQASLKSAYAPDARLKYFDENGRCGVIDESGKELSFLIEPDMGFDDEDAQVKAGQKG